MKVRAALVAVCALVAVAVSTTPAGAVTPVVVVATPKIETTPEASTAFLAWTQSPVNSYSTSSVKAESIGGTPFSVTSKGTFAFTGGIDGSTLIYTEYSQSGDIALFDLATKTALPVPAGVNTKANEEALGISGSHLLFARRFNSHYSIVLFDTATSTSLVLYSHKDTSRRIASLIGAQLNGNYATWDQYVYTSPPSFREVRCDVTLYDIATATATKVPNPDKKCQSGPAVSADGTLYFDRSGLSCGQHAKVIKQPLGGTESVVYALKNGHDFFSATAVDNGDGSTDLYFDPESCRTNHGDIWKLPGV